MLATMTFGQELTFGLLLAAAIVSGFWVHYLDMKNRQNRPKPRKPLEGVKVWGDDTVAPLVNYMVANYGAIRVAKSEADFYITGKANDVMAALYGRFVAIFEVSTSSYLHSGHIDSEEAARQLIQTIAQTCRRKQIKLQNAC